MSIFLMATTVKERMENSTKTKLLHLLSAQATALENKYAKILASLFEVEDFRYENDAELANFIQSQNADTVFLAPVITGNDLMSLPKEKIERVTLYHTNEETNSKQINFLKEKFSLFNFDAAPSTDLIRILYQHFHKKKTSGVYSLMEKGSLILGEKIQNQALIGTILDQLADHLSKVSPAIYARMYDIRQLVTAMVAEAFKHSEIQPYPTVDFQFSTTTTKATFAIRFPKGKIEKDFLRSNIVSGESLPWFLAWRAADYLLIHHLANTEIEVKGLLFANQEKTSNSASLLIHSSNETSSGKNFLIAPTQYSFALINEIKTAKLPKKEGPLNQESATAEEKEEKIKVLGAKLKSAHQEIFHKKNEILKTINDYEAEIETWKKNHAELSKKLEFFTNKVKDQQEQINKKTSTSANITSLNTKSSDKERDALAEKLQIAEKRFTLIEQKYFSLQKELQEKDSTITKIKGELLKATTKLSTKEQASETASAANNTPNANKELQTKMREFESKEATYKQEIKKLTFKLEAGEKNVKAVRDEFADKAKIMSEKLEAAKLKEVELLKKIEELGGLLKKASKAA